MPLSEPMKAAIGAIVVAIVVAVGVVILGIAVAAAGTAIANAIKAEAIGSYAGVGGFSGRGVFEDRLDLN